MPNRDNGRNTPGVGGVGGWWGALGFEWVPTAKQLRGVDGERQKIGAVSPYGGKWGRSISDLELIRYFCYHPIL